MSKVKAFRPMLAALTTESDLEKLFASEWFYASPKLDGIRGLVKEGQLLSRSLKPIPNAYTQLRFSQPYLEGLDGELILGDPTDGDVYRRTNSAVMSRDGEPDVTFYVFDHHSSDGSFAERLQQVACKARETLYAVPLPHEPVHTLEALTDMEAAYLEAGYEGVILRHPDRAYKFGRSTVNESGMLKVKRFIDGEAEIIGMNELMHNSNEATVNELGLTERSSHKANKVPMGVMGNLEVRDLVTGVEFEIGSGFKAADREWFWEKRETLIGSIVKYKSFPIGVKDKPRQPVYLGLRSHLDMDAA